ncbi:MAG: LPS translocon maturation chaperone LptM [Betaproteobacteria bacterium]
MVVAGLLAACGQKGPLTLPKPAATAAAGPAPAAPAASAPAVPR